MNGKKQINEWQKANFKIISVWYVIMPFYYKTIMKPLKQEDLKELTEKVLDLIAKTSVEIGHRTDNTILASLSKIFAQDLIQERRFGNMTFNQIQDAFRLGVRFGDFEPFINIRTFYKWVYAHKKTIDEYQEKLDMPKCRFIKSLLRKIKNAKRPSAVLSRTFKTT
jgi:hypothetical protein